MTCQTEPLFYFYFLKKLDLLGLIRGGQKVLGVFECHIDSLVSDTVLYSNGFGIGW